MNETDDNAIGGLPLQEWAEQFETVPGGFAEPHPELRGVVGLFSAVQDGRTVYVGRATELRNRGLYKRLADFWRDGDSGRKHYAGCMIFENLRTLELRVLITGNDRKALGLAKLLRKPMIDLHRPAWNVVKAKATNPV